MVIKMGGLLLITLFLASASLSLSDKDPITEELDRCLDRCQSLRWSTEKVISCQGRCAHDYYKQRQEEEPEDEVPELVLNTSDEKTMVKVCERGCLETHPGMEKMCEQYCEQRYGPKDEEEDQEWDSDMDLSLNAQDPKKKQHKEEKCKQRCRKKSKAYKQPECVEKCEKKFGEKEQGERE